jgi:hypothetical protein
MTLELSSVEAETVKGVPVSVKGIAQVKVMANKYMTTKEAKKKNLAYNIKKNRGPTSVDNPLSMEGASTNEDDDIVETANIDIGKIKIAAQHFLGRNQGDIREALRLTMEGHQRQILGTLTVEDLFRDRAAFSNRVREHVTEDLSSMGFCLVSYTVTKTKIDDDAQGYMKALGATQTGHDSMTAWPKAGGKETVPSQSSPCSYGLVDDPFGVSASDRRRQWTPSCDTRCARRRKDVLACPPPSHWCITWNMPERSKTALASLSVPAFQVPSA